MYGYPAWANPYANNFAYMLDTEVDKTIRESGIDMRQIVTPDTVRKNLIKAIIKCRKDAQKYAITKEAIEAQVLIRLLNMCTDSEREILRSWFGDYIVRLPGVYVYEYIMI